MTKNLIVFTTIFLFIMQLLTSCTDKNLNDSDQTFQLNLKAPIDKWDDAIPLGNGLTGGLLWGEGNEIRLSLDRGDLWDNRPHPGFNATGFTYEMVCRMAQSGQTDLLNEQYARGNDYPTKLPGCRLVVTMPEDLQAQSFQLDMKKGLGLVNLGKQNIECFFSAVNPYILMKIPGKPKDFQLVANKAVTKLGNSPAMIKQDENSTWLIQDALPDLQYVFYVGKKQVKDHTLLAITVTTNKECKKPFEEAKKRAENALDDVYNKQLAEHEKWWANFWGKSGVTLPNSIIQQQYNLDQYFYGAASRDNAPPMALQAVWTADAGTLPPWHGDYHHDLNTELTYWAYLTSNHFDQGLSFLNFMWSLKPVHEEFARKFYGTSGLVVPGVMALNGKPMGAWYQYTLSPTMGAWVAQSFYSHWLYTMDTQFLKERAYPYCTSVSEALVELMNPDENGKLKLPLSSSPEIHNNSQKAWLKPNSNFDLSLIRWLFGVNADMAKDLGREKDEVYWSSLLAQMDDLSVKGDDGALLVAPGESLTESHRHFSHLMAIYPLGLIDVEGTDHEQKIIAASLDQIDSLGSKLWCGYSFSWMACMRARAGQADKALENLNNYLVCTSRNGFHQNGPQTRKDLPAINMRAFTLEGNFAAAQAVHEMLLQSWGGRIRIFPATPEIWKDVSFDQWRAEGGFIVNAERKGGRTVRVSITATVDQLLRLKNPFEQNEFKSNFTIQKSGDDEFLCQLKKGQTLTLSRKQV